jgi:hypothetical protein
MIGNGAPHRLICFFDLQVCGTSNDVIGNHSVEIELDDTNIFFSATDHGSRIWSMIPGQWQKTLGLRSHSGLGTYVAFDKHQTINNFLINALAALGCFRYRYSE